MCYAVCGAAPHQTSPTCTHSRRNNVTVRPEGGGRAMKRIVYICLIFSEQRIRHSHYQNLLKLCSTTSPFPFASRSVLTLVHSHHVNKWMMPTVLHVHVFVALLHASCCRAFAFMPTNCSHPFPLQLCATCLCFVLAGNGAAACLLQIQVSGMHGAAVVRCQ